MSREDPRSNKDRHWGNEKNKAYLDDIKTNCEICGGSLMHPNDIKEGVHDICFNRWKKENHIMGGS